MDLPSSESDINSQGIPDAGNDPGGVIAVPSHGNPIARGNTTTSASRYPSVASPAQDISKGHYSTSCSFNNHSAYEQQQITSLLKAVGTLHLVVAELKADQDAFRYESESTIRALSKQAKESEQIITLLRTKVERLETNLDIRQPISLNAKGCENPGRREPCNREQHEEEKDESDVDGRGFVHGRSPMPQSKDEEGLVVTGGAKRINSRGIETSRTEWETVSDSDHQRRGVTHNERREGDCSAPSAIAPSARAASATTIDFDRANPGGNARSLITDATSMMHSGNMGESIESTGEDPVDENPSGANGKHFRRKLLDRNSSMLCIGNCNGIASPNPTNYCDDGSPVSLDAVPAEIEIRPGTCHDDIRSEVNSVGFGAARMPNRSDHSVSLISDVSFYNANHDDTTTGNKNALCSTSTDEDLTRKLEDLRLVIEETRRISRGSSQRRLHGRDSFNNKQGFGSKIEDSQSRLLSNLETLNASFTKISNSRDTGICHNG